MFSLDKILTMYENNRQNVQAGVSKHFQFGEEKKNLHRTVIIANAF